MDKTATSTAHTPAPWSLSTNDKTVVVSGKTVYGYGNVAEVPYDDCDHEEAKANARLIAAAPELLEACKMLLSLVDDEGNAELLMQNDFGNLNEAMLYARPAIAKAEGSSIVS